MKQLLVIAFIFSSFTILAQTNPHFRIHTQRVMKYDSLGNLTLSEASKAPAPGIYRLPVDRMPCIVPDTRGERPIPNAWKTFSVPFSGNIPNPAVPKVFSFRNKKTG